MKLNIVTIGFPFGIVPVHVVADEGVPNTIVLKYTINNHKSCSITGCLLCGFTIDNSVGNVKPQEWHHGNSKCSEVQSRAIGDDPDRTQDKSTRLKYHNVRIDGNSNWKSNDIVKQDDVYDSFENFF